VVAADDGVMPQTREHAAVLGSLGVVHGVVAVTKADIADPGRAIAEAGELLPGIPAVPCSARTGVGMEVVRTALERAAAGAPGRAGGAGPPVLHVDRTFSVRGAGTVVTGTLWSGSVARGDTLTVQPAGIRVRVRAVQVHDQALERAEAGQRVALNLSGVAVADVARGDVVTDAALGPGPTYRIDARLRLAAPPPARVHVHHGARDVPARLVATRPGVWQARLEQPLMAAAGDRVVIRSIAPSDTLGGGVVLDAHPRRHGVAAEPPPDEAQPAVTGARAIEPAATPGRPALTPAALALEAQLLAAAHEPPAEAEIGDAGALRELRDAGRAVRVGRSLYAHPDALADVRARVEGIIGADGGVTIARLRDELGTSRKYAQAVLEHLDAARVTLRLPDDRRVLRRRSG